jgi:hypothetical protein
MIGLKASTCPGFVGGKCWHGAILVVVQVHRNVCRNYTWELHWDPLSACLCSGLPSFTDVASMFSSSLRCTCSSSVGDWCRANERMTGFRTSNPCGWTVLASPSHFASSPAVNPSHKSTWKLLPRTSFPMSGQKTSICQADLPGPGCA